MDLEYLGVLLTILAVIISVILKCICWCARVSSNFELQSKEIIAKLFMKLDGDKMIRSKHSKIVISAKVNMVANGAVLGFILLGVATCFFVCLFIYLCYIKYHVRRELDNLTGLELSSVVR